MVSCNTTNSTEDTVELRLSYINFSLGLVHNSHLGRSFSTPENAYSAVITFEFELTDETNYLNIPQFSIIDEENEGWTFDSTAVREAYNPDNNSLIFENLELRKFDQLNRKLFSAQFQAANGDIIRQRAFELDNDFPLPATTSIELLSDNDYMLSIDFYSTPYDGGSLPFPVTIYNTYFSSNTFSISWTDASNNVIQEDFIDKESLVESESDTWTRTIDSASIPDGAVKVYTTFRRGRFTRGGVLYTELISLP
ncbi:MAG: hypothetical protein JJ895_03550 [Balneolaceae bacterium]|nr:hypothetical protein [Balneolaceae bacterium]